LAAHGEATILPATSHSAAGSLSKFLDGHHIGRLDIAMNEVVMMSFREGLSQLDGDIERSGRR